MKLTRQQRRVLTLLAAGQVVTPPALASMLDTGKEGAAMTASSLVRRGLLQRERDVDPYTGRRRGVAYRITAAGVDVLRHDQLAFPPQALEQS